jgi:hypothetical protein
MLASRSLSPLSNTNATVNYPKAGIGTTSETAASVVAIETESICLENSRMRFQPVPHTQRNGNMPILLNSER